MPTPIFPLGTPGAVVQLQATDTIHTKFGLYAGDAGPGDKNDHGFDWRWGGSAGVSLFAEIAADLGPSQITLGGHLNTGDFESFVDGSEQDGLGIVYVMVDQCFVDGGDSSASLHGFLRSSIATSEDVAVVEQYIDGGIVWSNAFLSGDAVGLGVSHAIFADSYLSATREAGDYAGDAETVIELTYQVPVLENLTLQPDLQYIINPHFSGDDAFLAGLRASISF